MVSLSSDLLSDNIAYYVEGSDKIAKKLKLVLNINNKNTEKESLAKFLSLAKNLHKKALGLELPRDIKKSILQKESNSKNHKSFSIVLKKDEWPTKKGYTITLSIGKI